MAEFYAEPPNSLRARTGNVDRRRRGNDGFMRPAPLSGTPSPSLSLGSSSSSPSPSRSMAWMKTTLRASRASRRASHGLILTRL